VKKETSEEENSDFSVKVGLSPTKLITQSRRRD